MYSNGGNVPTREVNGKGVYMTLKGAINLNSETRYDAPANAAAQATLFADENPNSDFCARDAA